MKKLLLPMFAVALAAMLFVPGVPSVSGAPVTVTGTIVDENDVPLEGILVEIDVGGTVIGTYTTAANGQFTIDGVDMAHAKIRFSLDGVQIFVAMSYLADGWYDLSSRESTGGNIGFVQTTTAVGYVGGLVTGDTGHPLGGVRVEFEGQGKSVAVFTGSDGKYFINTLDTGPYTVTAERSGFRAEQIDFFVDKSDETTRQTVPTFVLTSNSATYLLGFDMGHTLMIVGLILSLVIVTVSTAYAVKMKRRHDEGLEE